MKVLLLAAYHPHIGFGTKRQDLLPSEALLILYAVLREAGHQPIMRNFTTNVVEAKPDPVQFSYDTVLKIIKEERPTLVGITCLFGGDFPYATALAKFIKKNDIYYHPVKKNIMESRSKRLKKLIFEYVKYVRTYISIMVKI